MNVTSFQSSTLPVAEDLTGLMISRRSLRGVLFHVRIVGDLAEGKVQGVDLALASSQGEPPHGILMVLLIRHVELCTSDTQGS